MYPRRPPMPRRPVPRRPALPPPPPFLGPPQSHYIYPKPNVLSSFQTADGKWDVEKISTTAQQVMKIYNQVRPMINNFIKK